MPGTSTRSFGQHFVRSERDAFHAYVVLAGVASITFACVVAAIFPTASLFLWPLPFAAMYLWVRPSVESADVALEGGVLTLRSRKRVRSVALTEVVSAMLAPSHSGASVGVELRGGRRLLIECASRSDADELLDALGYDVTSRRVAFRQDRIFYRLLTYGMSPFAGGLTALTLAAAAREFGYVVPGWIVACVWVVVMLGFPRLRPKLDVVVGRDGLEAKGRLGRRFIPWSRVLRVEPVGGSFVLHYADASREFFWCEANDDWVLPAVCARIDEALKRYRGGERDALELLGRGGRSLDEWRGAMQDLDARKAGYRDQAFGRERLEALLDDASGSAEQRIAAALALSKPGDEAGRTRVRVAAETSASPAMREVFEEIADGDAKEATVDAALRRS